MLSNAAQNTFTLLQVDNWYSVRCIWEGDVILQYSEYKHFGPKDNCMLTIFDNCHANNINNIYKTVPDSKVYWANTGPIWGRQDPVGPHVGPMNFAISGVIYVAIRN